MQPGEGRWKPVLTDDFVPPLPGANRASLGGKCTPVPESVFPDRTWKVEETHGDGAVDIEKGLLEVPLTGNPEHRSTRTHEMVHILLSPEKRSKLRAGKDVQKLLSCFEDFRVQAFQEPERLRPMISNRFRHRQEMREVKWILDRIKSIPKEIRDESIDVRNKRVLDMSLNPFIPPDTKIMSYGAQGLRSFEVLDDGHRLIFQLLMEKETNAYDRMTPMERTRALGTIIEEHQPRHERNQGDNKEQFLMEFRTVWNAIVQKLGGDVELAQEYLSQLRLALNEIAYVPTFKQVLKSARRFARESKKIEKCAQASQAIEKKCAPKEGAKPVNEEMLRGAKEMLKRGVPTLQKGEKNATLKEALEGVSMRIKGMPLENYKPTMLARKKKPEYVGGVPKHMERLPFEGQVFENKRRGKGGTVLVDVSGSMHLSGEELEKIVKGAPAVKVAVYSGQGRPGPKFNTGQLSIVALGGRMATVETLEKAQDEGGQYNVIDIPALEWLLQQPAPRIWVSDGGITGTRHREFPIINQTAGELMLRGSIIRVGSVEKALELFGRNIRMMDGQLVEG